MDIQTLLIKIDDYKILINTRRPLMPEETRKLDAYFRIGSTYASNALEGNTLTLSETKVILEDGITVGGKPLRDCYEAVGHARAYDNMLETARSEPFTFSESMVLQLHKLFHQRVDPDRAGVYRGHQVFITGTEHVPPAAREVPALMGGLVKELGEKWNGVHPVRLAAFAHRRLADIHPFADSNGRTARMMMNLILVNRGYQVVSIPPVLRLEYNSALKAAQREKNPATRRLSR